MRRLKLWSFGSEQRALLRSIDKRLPKRMSLCFEIPKEFTQISILISSAANGTRAKRLEIPSAFTQTLYVTPNLEECEIIKSSKL